MKEQRLSQVFVELADTLIDDFDVVDLLTVLAARVIELLPVDAAGIMLTDQRGSLQVMASSSEAALLLGLFELQNAEGPCLDCFRTGRPVVNQPLAEPSLWPSFAQEAREAGFVMTHAFPLRLRDRVIGALNLLHADVTELSPGEAQLAQAMADVATVGILQERALTEARVLAEQLQTALNSRVVIEQAKGFVAQRLGIGVDRAFELLRSYARSNNRRLADVARSVIAGELPAERLA